MQSIKKRTIGLNAASIKKRIELSKYDFKKSPKTSEGGYMWVG
ncbi:MAG: hypothetical protein ACI94Y_000011 [Maribacter sp.]|jgi:hypothetical protein